MSGGRSAAIGRYRPGRTFEIAEIAAGETWKTALVMGRAFLDDPISTAVGPHRRGHRRIAGPVSFMGVLIASARHGGTIRVAREPGTSGRVLGVSVSFVPGAWPIPEGAAAYEIGWLLIAGPAPLRRGLDFDRRIRAAHPAHPHCYLWFLAVDPSAQGRGIGRALLEAFHRDAAELDVPSYLETGKQENVPWYASQGYRHVGDLKIASGEPLWLLERNG